MSEDTRFPDQVADLPGSARFVYRALEAADDPLTKQDLRRETGYRMRAIETATRQLKDRDEICEFWDDGRKYYQLRDA